MFLEIGAEDLDHRGLHGGRHFGIAEFRFCLAFKLRVGKLDADHGGEAFPEVFAFYLDGVVALEQVVAGDIVVDGARKSALEPDKMRAAVDGVDVVGKGKNVLDIRIVVLHDDFDFHVVALLTEIDRLLVKRNFVFVEVFDK